MKKKGFTLIELLAVIVILAVIALITTPIILNMISTAKKGAAKSSALGYIDAVEKEAMMNQLDPLKENIKDGTYFVEDLRASYKGVGPDEGLVIIKNGKVEEAKLCINKYSVYYKDSKAEIATNNYCSEEFTITLNIGDNKKEQTIKKVTETTFDINGIDISNKTNMSCNNGSIPSIENNTFKVSNIFGNTTCYINDTLEETVGNLDSSMTNIIMLKDEQFKNEIKINSNNDVVLDLNGKAIGPYRIANYGDLKINDSVGTGTLIGIGQALSNAGTGTLIINGGYYERTEGSGTTIYEEGTGKLIINGGKFVNSDTGTVVQNRLPDSTVGGDITINGGEFKSNATVIRNYKGTLNINQTNKPIHILSLSQTWTPAINSSTDDFVNISGKEANECTNDPTKTTSGLCVYAEGTKNYSSNTSNTAVSNTGNGTININGGTYFGGWAGITNHYAGTINILNGKFSSGNMTIDTMREAIINVCGGTINSLKYDLWIASTTTTGIINYSNSVMFTNGVNNPTIGGSLTSTNVIGNYQGTCTKN